jgi:hypothetical protein
MKIEIQRSIGQFEYAKLTIENDDEKSDEALKSFEQLAKDLKNKKYGG